MDIISEKDLSVLLDLSKLKLNDEKEVNEYRLDISKMIGEIDKLERLHLEDIEPCLSLNNKKNVFKEDIVGETLSTEDVLKNTKEQQYGYFKILKVMD